MRRTALMLLILAFLAILAGCGGDDGGPDAVTSVSLDQHAMEVEVGRAAVITPTVSGGNNKALTWYVNDIMNGDDVFGTITQNSPVRYNAPDSLPDPVVVEVRAVSDADTTKYDSCLVTVTFKVIHVDIGGGDDATGTGYAHQPVKTIKRGVELVQAGGTVLVAPGVYDTDHGETFPIYPAADATLEGEDWETCIIRGADKWGYAVDMRAGSTVRKFTFESTGELNIDRWEHYIQMRSQNIRVDSIRTTQRTFYSPIRIRNATNAIVENCVFEVPYLTPPTSGIGQNRGFEIIDGNEGTIIRGCTVSGFRQGILIGQDATTLIENCIFEENDYGVDVCCYQSTVSNPTPDLGGGARGSAGGNVFRNNVECGLRNETYNTIYALYNTWDNDPPMAGEDYCFTSTGGVIVEEL